MYREPRTKVNLDTRQRYLEMCAGRLSRQRHGCTFFYCTSRQDSGGLPGDQCSTTFGKTACATSTCSFSTTTTSHSGSSWQWVLAEPETLSLYDAAKFAVNYSGQSLLLLSSDYDSHSQGMRGPISHLSTTAPFPTSCIPFERLK